MIRSVQAAWAERHVYRNDGLTSSEGVGSEEKLPGPKWNLLRALKQRALWESVRGSQRLSQRERHEE